MKGAIHEQVVHTILGSAAEYELAIPKSFVNFHALLF